MTLLNMLRKVLEERIDRLMDTVERAPSWAQTIWAFTFMGSLAVIGGYVWYMTFGRVVLTGVLLFAAALAFGHWRWGFVACVAVAGTVWIFRAEYPAAAAMVTVASLLMAGTFTLPPRRVPSSLNKGRPARTTESTIVPPRLLYKYRSLVGKNRAFVELIFDSHQLYFAEPAELNDPAESHFDVSLDAEPADLFAHFVDYFQNHRGNPQEDAETLARRTIEIGQPSPEILSDMKNVAVESVRRKALILSLSSRGDDPLMWERYADQHRGICLVFDSTIVQPTIFSLALPVVYEATVPTFYPYRAWTRMQQEDRMESYAAVKPIAFTKRPEWRHEEEWRVVIFDPPKLRKFAAPSLVRVILGAEIDRADEETVRQWVDHHEPVVGIYRAEFDSDAAAVAVYPERGA